MKNIKSGLLSLLLLGLSNLGFAGDMGEPFQANRGYLGAEAVYASRDIDPLVINGNRSVHTNQNWGWRLSLGMLHFRNENFAFSAEFGGADYGKTRDVVNEDAVFSELSVTGYDALFGVLYKLQYFDVFFKAGAMVVNVSGFSHIQDLSAMNNGNLYNGNLLTRATLSRATPEFRVGGIYNVKDNWAFTVDYMYVFGSTMTMNYNVNATLGTGVTQSTNATIKTPTLNALLFGVRYYIV